MGPGISRQPYGNIREGANSHRIRHILEDEERQGDSSHLVAAESFFCINMAEDRNRRRCVRSGRKIARAAGKNRTAAGIRGGSGGMIL